MKKKILLISIFLAANLFAEYRAEKPAGEGTQESPYLMESVENLLWLSENVTNVAYGSYFLQTKDIDASETKDWRDGKGFPPIGICEYYNTQTGLSNVKLFCGTYDGDNHIIFGLNFYPSETECDDYYALFGGVTNSCLKNIILEDVTMRATHVCAALAARIASTSISNCHVNITFTQEDGACIGGLVGAIDVFGEIICCSAKVKDLKGSESGGLVGRLLTPSSNLDPSYIYIKKCYTEGNIYGDWVGGLISGGGRQPMEDCYSLVDMSGRGINVGGITAFGAGICKNCYHYGKIENGNPISGGDSSGTASSVYYCSEQGYDPNPGTIGKTYAELLKKETYEGWDFENVWYIEEDVSLPTLCWETPEPCIGGILLLLFGLFVNKKK